MVNSSRWYRRFGKDATLEENHTGKLSAGSALRPNCESDRGSSSREGIRCSLFIRMDLLSPESVKDWRRGRIPEKNEVSGGWSANRIAIRVLGGISPVKSAVPHFHRKRSIRCGTEYSTLSQMIDCKHDLVDDRQIGSKNLVRLV
jgi:hypothetical protein